MDTTCIEGLQLTATDVGRSFDAGPSVDGRGGAMLVSVTGRPALSELTGDVVQTLTARLAS